MDNKNLPNLLTASRIIVVPVLVVLMFIPTDPARWLSVILFSASS